MSVDVEGKSLVDLLDMLEPAPAPDPVSMVPQTWVWVVLAVLVAGLIAFGVHGTPFQGQRSTMRHAIRRNMPRATLPLVRVNETGSKPPTA